MLYSLTSLFYLYSGFWKESCILLWVAGGYELRAPATVDLTSAAGEATMSRLHCYNML